MLYICQISIFYPRHGEVRGPMFVNHGDSTYYGIIIISKKDGEIIRFAPSFDCCSSVYYLKLMTSAYAKIDSHMTIETL